jgi:hypothetical protein
MSDAEIYQLDENVLGEILANAEITNSYPGKRSSQRFAHNVPLSLLQEESGGPQRKLYVTGKDISLEGIGLTSREKFEEGDPVLIVLDHAGLSLGCYAQVKFCREEIVGYRVGLEWVFG